MVFKAQESVLERLTAGKRLNNEAPPTTHCSPMSRGTQPLKDTSSCRWPCPPPVGARQNLVWARSYSSNARQGTVHTAAVKHVLLLVHR